MPAYFTMRSFLTDLTPSTPLAILTCFIDGHLGIDETAQLHDAIVGLDIDLICLEDIVLGKTRLDLGRNDRIIEVLTSALCLGYPHDQVVFYGFDPFDAACDFARLIDSSLRINEAAQLNDAFAGFYADLK